MVITHKIQSITFHKEFMFLKVDGKEIKIALKKVSKKLAYADDFQRMIYKVSPSGYGIHWPLLDEDLSLESLLKNS